MTATDRYSVLTRVGKGTPMGKYMRFFWHPLGASIELKNEPKPITLLGEKLVFCAPKRVSLASSRSAALTAALRSLAG